MPKISIASPQETVPIDRARMRELAGRVCSGQATTGQIVRRILAGKLRAGIEARRRSQDTFQPLIFFPEFKALITGAKHNRPAPPRRSNWGSPPAWLLVAVTGSLLIGLLAGLAALGCVHL